MRVSVFLILAFVAAPASAMTEDEMFRCVTESPPVQNAVVLFQDAATLLYGNKIESLADRGADVLTRIEEERVKDCNKVGDIYLEETSKILKQLLAKQK